MPERWNMVHLMGRGWWIQWFWFCGDIIFTVQITIFCRTKPSDRVLYMTRSRSVLASLPTPKSIMMPYTEVTKCFTTPWYLNSTYSTCTINSSFVTHSWTLFLCVLLCSTISETQRFSIYSFIWSSIHRPASLAVPCHVMKVLPSPSPSSLRAKIVLFSEIPNIICSFPYTLVISFRRHLISACLSICHILGHYMWTPRFLHPLYMMMLVV